MTATLTSEWSYTPADFFEAPFDYNAPNYTVHIENGRAIATFVTDQLDSTLPEVHRQLEARFLGAQMVQNRPFQLSNYSTARTRPDGTTAMGVSVHETSHLDARLDVVHRDAAGNVIFDSKADRVKATAELAELAAKHPSDLVAEALLKSYNEAINNPSNGLTHLYEIRDALSKKFGGDEGARSTARDQQKRMEPIRQTCKR